MISPIPRFGQTHHVLHVDDSEIWQLVVEGAVSRLNKQLAEGDHITLTSCTDIASGKAALASPDTPVEAVVTDGNIDSEDSNDGQQMVDAARDKQVPVAVLSGSPENLKNADLSLNKGTVGAGDLAEWLKKLFGLA